MMIKDLITRNRSYRRFQEDKPVSEKALLDLVELARLSPSGGNKQPLKFFLSRDPETNDRIFPLLAWAAYLKDWPGPDPGERPAAYIIVLGDNNISNSFGCDHGIAAQSIMLGAIEKGLGGCIIASVQKAKLKQILNLAENLEILLVLALGQPKETVVVDQLNKEGDIRYWRDEQGIHHVPKRSLEELIIVHKNIK
jgi:nitroreductase